MQTLDLPPFNRDLATAHTLPARFYTDGAIYAAERERIFARTWQPVGRCQQVARPGDFFTCEVGGEPLVVLRDRGGTLRAFFNVCRHRAGPVAIGCGTRQSLTCRYHGWTYGLDGALQQTPEFDGACGFDKKDYGLIPVPVSTFGPIVLVNLDKDAQPLDSMLDSMLGAMREQTAQLSLADMILCERREYTVACNWKVYIDNYLEGYHIPLVHPALYRELDYSAYRVETFRYHAIQHAPLRATAAGADSEQRPFPQAGADAQALYYWVFPGWMLNIYPDHLQWNGVFPLAVDRTLTVFEWYVLPATSATTAQDEVAARAAIARGIAFGENTQREDMEICEAVQRRLGSRAYERGRFCVRRENGVHHFQSLVHEFLSRP